MAYFYQLLYEVPIKVFRRGCEDPRVHQVGYIKSGNQEMFYGIDMVKLLKEKWFVVGLFDYIYSWLKVN